MTQAHLIITGDVTGVGFRAWAKIQSKQYGVTGWVRNEYNDKERYGAGGVEMVIQGPDERVEQMIEQVKKGPSVAIVEEVDVHWQHPKEKFETFEIRK